MINREDNKNVLIKLFILIVIKIKKKDLPISYNSLGKRIIYDKAWDEMAELLIINKAENG